MARAAGGGGDREASGLCFFIFSVMIGWPEQLLAAGRREDAAFVFFIFL
jgi:hypothetical protein